MRLSYTKQKDYVRRNSVKQATSSVDLYGKIKINYALRLVYNRTQLNDIKSYRAKMTPTWANTSQSLWLMKYSLLTISPVQLKHPFAAPLLHHSIALARVCCPCTRKSKLESDVDYYQSRPVLCGNVNKVRPYSMPPSHGIWLHKNLYTFSITCPHEMTYHGNRPRGEFVIGCHYWRFITRAAFRILPDSRLERALRTVPTSLMSLQLLECLTNRQHWKSELVLQSEMVPYFIHIPWFRLLFLL